jgi:tetratricopeptide (TPR) repeat protein
MFLEHAAKLDPANAAYLESHLRAMLLAKPESALQMSKEILADVDKHHPIVVVRAANIRFNAIDPAQYTESALVCKNLELVLKHNLTRLEKCDEIASQFPDYCANLALLGLCNEFLGDVNAAADYYSRGILANPNDDLLLAARGILTYGQSAQSIVDLEQAAQLSTELIWPYYFLAHHYLSSQQYDRCRITCERGLQTAGTDLAKSQLEEWRAIAQSELGFSPDLVRTAFEAAIRLDPSNEQARRNLVRFEEALASNPRPQRLTWEQRTESAIRSFGLAERRFSLAA